MKIGILSMQKIHNYGSFLQAYSLKHLIEQCGHEVYFLDIENGKQLFQEEPAFNRFQYYLSKITGGHLIKAIQNVLFSRKMDAIHIKDFTEYLETDKKLNPGEILDLVFIGSDEVFNCTIPSPWGVSTQLLGNVENTRHVSTYAASAGTTTVDKIMKYGLTDDVSKSFEKIDHFSVRDANTADIVERFSEKKPVRHVDPVFLWDYDNAVPNHLHRKPYLLVYAYTNRIDDATEISAIQAFAKGHDLDVVSVGTQQRWCKYNIAASAFELLEYVKKASYIVTDTFHGTVFSIKFQKKFATIIRESNTQKLSDLLQHFGLEDHLASTDNLSAVLEKNVDADRISQLIQLEREKSVQYLKRVIEEASIL